MDKNNNKDRTIMDQVNESGYYSIWEHMTTRHGFEADEVISALQKSIRRAHEEDATRFAYELYTSSPSLFEKMWGRLLVISVEDIGFGNLEASVIINTLNQIRKNFSYDDPDQPLFFTHAIRVLCASDKDRSSDCLKNVVVMTANAGKVPEIPDFALDQHTRRGREMGRGTEHFLAEASKVVPEVKGNNDYRERFEELVRNYSDTEVEPGAFKFAQGRE